jgi:hypothetical protein
VYDTVGVEGAVFPAVDSSAEDGGGARRNAGVPWTEDRTDGISVSSNPRWLREFIGVVVPWT